MTTIILISMIVLFIEFVFYKLGTESLTSEEEFEVMNALVSDKINKIFEGKYNGN